MNDDRLARGLGWFSIGLGIIECLAPEKLQRLHGISGHSTLVRMYGVREIAAGVGILRATGDRGRARWLRVRLAGDVLDLATLATAFTARGAKRLPLALTTAAVATITAIDFIAQERLERAHVARSRALPLEGPDALLHGQRRVLTNDEKVDLESFDSFPASDPPGTY